ncbi:anti-sigma factor antagonist [Leptospira biflexa]|jgi:anti-anti-sigma factor|uniref:Anti-sigma factor antagonist n=1 Tax=Leptospira biflexa serovar Patoc (strain Patoc 1 / ATCC 23582 / Paris) TaxID=456481 RepID=B0SPA7_LEPBP|nr:STAS domain-containing protein [Leptospira biflexa]ABZ93789.1 AntiSigma factor antagonist [Leptospira biflexa serovar Patoc strain 'Patoc 1 (Ames)']ABZ97431.1 Putative anti-sigma factor antagonist [Leptospira biflexa serovar Patoc strain 'Patoc 1 (Paris)']TGM48172.1 anti-sigma factor antagonist [Leptospira biflexa]TGM49361.1 anti-sigma factor antagonist [Leptospira biflexa]TGM54630.1 anti-sigma factor antagonist [Leptospira biflexa]
MFQYEVKRENEKVIIILNGSLSLRDTPKLKTEIKELIDSDSIKELVLDFKYLSYLDSSGIGILLHTYSWTKEKNKKVKMVHVSNEIKTIFSVANLLEMFEIE